MVERQFKQVAQSMGSDALAYRFWWSGRSGVWLSYSGHPSPGFLPRVLQRVFQ